MGSDSINLCRD